MAVEQNPYRALLGNDAAFTAHLNRLGIVLEDDPAMNKVRRFLEWKKQMDTPPVVTMREDREYGIENPSEQLFIIKDLPVDFQLFIDERNSVLEIEKNNVLLFDAETLQRAVFVDIPKHLGRSIPPPQQEMFLATKALITYQEGSESDMFCFSQPEERYEFALEMQKPHQIHSVNYVVANNARNLFFDLFVESDSKNEEPILSLSLFNNTIFPPQLLSYVFENQKKIPRMPLPEVTYWEKLSQEITSRQKARFRP